MKKAFLLLIMAVSFGVMAQAQESTPKAKHNKENREGKTKMKEELNLSEKQSNEIKEINSEYKTRMKDIKNNESLSADQKKEQMRKLHQERSTRIHSRLTPEQQNKMQKTKKAAHSGKHKKDKVRA